VKHALDLLIKNLTEILSALMDDNKFVSYIAYLLYVHFIRLCLNKHWYGSVLSLLLVMNGRYTNNQFDNQLTW